VSWRSPKTLGTRLTLWYVGVLAVLLIVYAAIVFLFQYVALTRQMLHDEIQDVVTVEGLLYTDSGGHLQLRQDYFSRPQSHLLVDRYMEVRSLLDRTLYRSATLHDMPLGGPLAKGEGDSGFDDRVVKLGDGSHVFVISHVHSLNGQDTVIRLGYSLAPLRIRMLQFLMLLVIAIPVALALAALAGQAIARRALRPIDEMSTRAAGISAHNLQDRLTIADPHDELGRMAAVFNLLLERLDQSFVQLRRFTADAAHELRTPLTAMRTIGEVALTDGDPEKAKDALVEMLDEASQLAQTIDSLLLLSRAETTSGVDLSHPVPVRELMAEVLALLGPVMEDSGVRVQEVKADDSQHIVYADRALLRTALLNLLHNAWKFSPPGSTIMVTYRKMDEPSSCVEISVADEGPGIESHEVESVFNRFYTGRNQPDGGTTGNGLGLSIAKLIIERTGGRIFFETAVEQGARCVIQIPLGAST
jgi:signal transduction histidine kinase